MNFLFLKFLAITKKGQTENRRTELQWRKSSRKNSGKLLLAQSRYKIVREYPKQVTQEGNVERYGGMKF